jgi:hypothetical protein
MSISPDELFKTDRKDGFFTIEAKLSLVDASTPAFKSSPFDRFLFSWVDLKSKTGIKANLSISDYPLFCFSLNKAKDDYLDYLHTPKSSNSSLGDIATVAIPIGEFQGKTVMDALKEGKRDELVRTGKWFEGNLAKFPNNKKFIDLINEGVKLFDEGKLNEESSSSVTVPPQYSVYKSATKYFKSEVDEKKRTKCYRLELYLNAERDYPFTMQITNFYAPLENNLPKLSEKTPDTTKVIHLSFSEICDILFRLERTQAIFDIANAPFIMDRINKERYHK